MIMKYLYNDKELLRYGNIIAFIFFCTYIVGYAINTSVIYMISNGFVQGFIVWIVVEILLLCIWYPDEIRRKNAFKNGEVIEGIIIATPYKKRERFILSRNPNGYTIVVELEINGAKKSLEFGEYSINPDDYVPLNHKCNIYVYKNRFYLERLKSHKRAKNTVSKISNTTEYHVPSKKEMEYMVHNIKYPIEEIKELDIGKTTEAAIERQKLSMIRSKKC